MNTRARIARRLALTVAILAPLSIAGAARAQSPVSDAHWMAWLGCWQPTGPQPADPTGDGALSTVCVIPGSGATPVEVVTVKDGAIADRDAIPSAGERHELNEEGCMGWESADWSRDGRRLYRTSQQDCTGGIQREATALLTILPDGDWLNAQGLTVNGNTRIRVLRYRPTELSSALPAEAVRAIDGNARAIDAARSNAALAPSTEDIIDASNSVDGEVVSAWLIEQGQGFAIDSKELGELADAGVDSQVIDVMVALSYPDVFAINEATAEGEFRPDQGDTEADRSTGYYPGMWDPWGYGPGWGWGYPPFGFGYRGYGYGGYGYGGYGGFYGSPIVIIRQPSGGSDEQPTSRGPARAVKGKGYTRPSTGSGRAVSRPSPRRESISSGGARSSGGSSGSSSGAQRKAKPRGS